MVEILVTGDRELSNAIKRAVGIFNGYYAEYCEVEDSLIKIGKYPHVMISGSPYLKEEQRLILSTIPWLALVREKIKSVSVIFGFECLDINNEYSGLESFVNFFSPPFELTELINVFTKVSYKPKITLSIHSHISLTRAIGRLNHDAIDKLGLIITRVIDRKEISQNDQILWDRNISEGKRYYTLCEDIFKYIHTLFEQKDSQYIEEYFKNIKDLFDINLSEIDKIKKIYGNIKDSKLYKLGLRRR